MGPIWVEGVFRLSHLTVNPTKCATELLYAAMGKALINHFAMAAT